MTYRVRRVILVLAALGVGVLLLAPKPWDLPTGPGFAEVPGRRFRDTLLISLYWATALNVLLAAGLAVSVSWWGRPLEAARDPSRRFSLGRGFALALCALLALGAALRLPLASRSLWWDEAWSIRQVIVGPVEPSSRDPHHLEHSPPRWARTLWYYNKPTNHVTYNLLARACVDLERRVSGRLPWQFSDRAFRAPAFLAALASIALLALWLARLGAPLPGLAAAALLVLHPWHIRYGTEGRAYTLSLLFALLAAASLGRALERRDWRAWLQHGLCVGLLLWTQPANVYLAATLGLAALVAIVAQRTSRRDRLTLAMRLVVTNLLAGMAFLQLTAPHIAQSLAWTDVWQSHPTITPRVLTRLWSLLSFGIPYSMHREGVYHDPFPELRLWVREEAWVGPLVFGVFPLLLTAGAWQAWRRLPRAHAPLAALVAALPLLLAVSGLNRMYFYPRFAIHGLLPLCIFAALGTEGALRALAERTRAPSGPIVIAGLVLLLGGFGAFVWPQTRILLSRPYAPGREVAQWLGERAGPDPTSVLRAGFGLGAELPRIYDPWVKGLHSEPELEALEQRARQSGKTLYVFYGYRGQNTAKRPGGIARLEDPQRYLPEAVFQGIEPQFTYRILRLRSSGAEGAEDARAASTPSGGPPILRRNSVAPLRPFGRSRPWPAPGSERGRSG